MQTRDDTGALWENFCAIERLKCLQTQERRVRSYYLRNTDQREIDIIEEEAGALRAFECKLNPNESVRVPIAFIKLYPHRVFDVVNTDNFVAKLLS